jgi:hypothetical protein
MFDQAWKIVVIKPYLKQDGDYPEFTFGTKVV